MRGGAQAGPGASRGRACGHFACRIVICHSAGSNAGARAPRGRAPERLGQYSAPRWPVASPGQAWRTGQAEWNFVTPLPWIKRLRRQGCTSSNATPSRAFRPRRGWDATIPRSGLQLADGAAATQHALGAHRRRARFPRRRRYGQESALARVQHPPGATLARAEPARDAPAGHHCVAAVPSGHAHALHGFHLTVRLHRCLDDAPGHGAEHEVPWQYDGREDAAARQRRALAVGSCGFGGAAEIRLSARGALLLENFANAELSMAAMQRETIRSFLP